MKLLRHRRGQVPSMKTCNYASTEPREGTGRAHRKFVPVPQFFLATGKPAVRLRQGEEAQTLVIVALSLTVLMGFLAFATDLGVMLRQRRIAQTVADSAAM